MAFYDWLSSSPPATWLQALGTPVIGLAAAYIAYQSSLTAKKKLKFDMFEKRVDVYRQVSEAFVRAAQFGTFSAELIRHLEGLAAQARFLYADDGIDRFLAEARKHAMALYWEGPPTRYNESGQPTPPEFDGHAHYRELALSHYYAQIQHGPRPGMLAANPERETWLRSAIWFGQNTATWDDVTLPYLKVFH